jgi:hypothetical protein
MLRVFLCGVQSCSVALPVSNSTRFVSGGIKRPGREAVPSLISATMVIQLNYLTSLITTAFILFYLHIKAIPVQPWTGPEGSRRLRLPDFQESRHMKVLRLSALRTGRLYPPGNIPGTHFCRGTEWCSWLRHCATSRKVAGSIPDGVTVIFNR